MTEKADGRSPSLEAVRALERQLAERAAGRSAIEDALAVAQEHADRVRARARARGEEAAANRRRQVLDEVDREAARIRAESDHRAGELSAALAASRPRTLAALSSVVIPATEDCPCSSP